MTNTIEQTIEPKIEHAPAQDHRVTSSDAVVCLVSLLEVLAARHPPLWRDVLRIYHAGRQAYTETEIEAFLRLFKSPREGGLVGGVESTDLCWNVGVHEYWDAVDDCERRQLVVGVWREGVMGTVRQWQGESALGLVKRALKVLAEDQP